MGGPVNDVVEGTARIALFATCLADTMSLRAAQATVSILKRLRHKVVLPEIQVAEASGAFRTGAGPVPYPWHMDAVSQPTPSPPPATTSLTSAKRRRAGARASLRGTLSVAFALVLGVTALAGCAPSNLPTAKSSKVSTTDAVLAIRLSTLGTPGELISVPAGHLLLVKEDGTGTVLEVGAMINGHPLWNEAGLTVSTPEDELLIDDQGLTRTPRGLKQSFEVNRFPTTDGRGFMAFYSRQGTQSVFKGDEHGNLERTDNEGMFATNGHCGDRVLSVTDSFYSQAIAPDASMVAAKEYEAGTLSEPVPEGARLDVLVQVYPHPEGKPVVLGATAKDESLEETPSYATCYQDVLYVPTFQQAHPDASPVNGLDPKAGQLVMQSWDLSTGRREVTPVTMPDGSPVPLTRDQSSSDTGHMNGSTYTMVTTGGEVLSVDVTTGVVTNSFQIPLTDSRQLSKFVVTDTDVFALDVPWDTTEARTLTLTRYDLETGQPHPVMTIENVDHYLDGNLLTGPLSVESIALRPSYLRQITR